MDRRNLPPAGAPALALATCLGIGYIPFASGTFGSLPGLLLTYLAHRAAGPPAAFATLLGLLFAGTWAAGRAERHFGVKDSGKVVIDEVVGQMMALLFLPLTAGTLLCGFVLFRVFDILKPFPVRRFESLPGGSGIMADDLMAGLYANLALQGLHLLFPEWLGAAAL